jgi:streptogramin lyase
MQRHAELYASLLLLSTIGCGASDSFTSTAADTPSATGVTLHGAAFGGQQPISGAHVYLMTTGSSGYASAATSILTKGDGTDSGGTYVLTDANGRFTITGDYTCTPGALTYVIANGGNPGLAAGTNNAAIILSAVLGACPSNSTFLGAIPSIFINEATTVATAYGLAAFAADSTHIGAANTTGAAAGLATAFNSAMQLVNPFYGYTYTTTAEVPGYLASQGLSANGTAPAARLNTIADIIFSCVNSDGTGTSCSRLFSNAKNTAGTAPTDTFTAAINIAQHPTTNVSTLFNLILTNAPFQPSLGTTPADFTLAIAYTAPNTSTPTRAALDASGNLWFPNYGNNSLTELSSTGVVLSGTTGFTGGSLNQPWGLAVNPKNGSLAVANNSGGKVSTFSSNGTAGTASSLSGSAYSVAFDSAGTAYVANSAGASTMSLLGVVLSLLSTSSTTYGIAVTSGGSAWTTGYSGNVLNNKPLLTVQSYSGGGLNAPAGIATDASGNFWVANSGANSISKFNSSGTAVSTSAGYTGGGVTTPWGLAVDGDGKVFVANSNGTLSEFSSTGTAISTASGYATGSTASSYSVAIDNAGNVWSPNSDGKIYKFIGLAAPVSLPMSNTTAGVRP